MARKRVGTRTIKRKRVRGVPELNGAPLMPDAARPLGFSTVAMEKELKRQTEAMSARGDRFFRGNRIAGQ